jgi:hemolysin activation/secretion protein
MAGYGEPQHDDDPMIYRRTQQAAVGLEWERPLSEDGWASFYTSAGLGWQQERIFGDDERVGENSDTDSQGALLATLGWRFNAGELFSNLNFRIQLGLSAWIPLSDAQLDMSGESFDVQEPSFAITLGLTLGQFSD